MFFDLKFKNIKNQKIILLVLLGFFLSVLVSINYVSKFDNYEISSDDFENHSMVKSDLLKFWIDAEKINNQIKEGKTYFETGSEYRTPYLPSRTILLFYKITGYDLYDLEKKVKSDNGKLLFFIFQALLYYFSLIYFSKILSNKYSKTACLFIIIFLAFEPTLLLYHSSFWSESIFFSIQIILLTLVLKNSKIFFFNILIGFLIGLLTLQRSVAIGYILPVVIYYMIVLKKKSIKPIIFLFFGYFLIIIFLGLHNYIRSNNLYFTATQSKDGLYDYFLPTIVSKENQISVNEAKIKLIKKSDNYIKRNKINLNLESDRLKYYEFKKDKSLEIIKRNLFESIVFALKKTAHFVVLDPFRHVYYFYKYEYKGKLETRFYKSEKHQGMIKLRIFYSLIIYLISILGFISMLKNKEDKSTWLIFFSIFYFIILTGWVGNTRYFAPCLVYLSIFFGNGMESLNKIFFKKDNHTI